MNSQSFATQMCTLNIVSNLALSTRKLSLKNKRLRLVHKNFVEWSS